MSDERQGLPSASSMKRTRRCPGWLNLARSLPTPDSSTKDSDAGESRHSLIEIEADTSAIEDSNEAYTVERAGQLRAQAIEQVLGGEPEEVSTEERFWLFNDDLQPLCSARLDWLGVRGENALVCDYKTLFGDHGHAADNEQLAVQAVTVWHHYGHLSSITLALIQPNLPKEQQMTMVKYGPADIRRAEAEIKHWCLAAQSPHAPRIPGSVQCEHCPCRADCPEAIAAELAITIADIREVSAPEAMGHLLESAVLADRVVKAIRDKAKRMLDDGTAIPGWQLEEGAEMRKVTDAEKLAGVLASAGATQQQISGIAKIGLTDADKLYYQLRKASDGKTQKESRQELEATLIQLGAMEKSRKAPSLVKIK